MWLRRLAAVCKEELRTEKQRRDAAATISLPDPTVEDFSDGKIQLFKVTLWCPMLYRYFLTTVAVSFLLASDALAQDWPQWRGSQRDGVIAEPITPADKPTLDWTAKIAGGYSGPTVSGKKVYVMDRVTEPNQIERVHCFDQATGENIWTHQYDAIYRGIGYPAGP